MAAGDLFASVFEAAPDAILVVERAGRIVLANGAAEALFGYPRAELVGAPVEMLLPEALRARHEAHRAAYGDAPRPRPMGAGLALTARACDGREVPVEISLSPVMYGADSMVTAVVRDVSDRASRDAALRESERRFHAIFDTAFQFMGLLSPSGTLVLVNQAALDLVGVTADSVIGQPVWSTPWWQHSSAEQARLREAIAAAARGECVRFETTHPRKDGTLAIVDFSVKPIRDAAGEVVLLVPEGRDLSEREDLRRALERLRDDLTQMMVHDLKNPVAGIQMTLQLTRRKYPDLPDALQRNLRQIETACLEMTRLIQNLLEIGKLEEGKMPVASEPVALADVARAVATEYGVLAEQAGRRLELSAAEPGAAAVADYALVKRVLVNLVMNALRHSGGHVVRIETTPGPEPATVTLCVRDDGRGIPPEEQARMFEKFVSGTAAAARREAGDTGLGLPFCKLAVERMGGRIDLTSVVGTGSAFVVTLPAHTTPQ